MDDQPAESAQTSNSLPIANPAPEPHTNASHAPQAHAPNAQHAPGQPRPPMQLREPNTILVGKKSVMAYVLAVVSQFNNGSDFVKIKARGQLISRAVDVAEIVRHRFLATAHPKEIKINTEDLQSEDGTMSKVSSIEIVLVK